MTDVCRDFGVSHKTGYKIFDRYREHGLEALSDRSRRLVRYATSCRNERGPLANSSVTAALIAIGHRGRWCRTRRCRTACRLQETSPSRGPEVS
jgi:hypothetical protein